MNKQRKPYQRPTIYKQAIAVCTILAPSAHNQVGDEEELTRHMHWWEKDDAEDADTPPAFP